MSSPSFTMRQLLEAGVHFGHHTRRWNPKMDAKMPPKMETHRALDDIIESIEELKFYRENFFK